MALGMEQETVNSIEVNDQGELLLLLESGGNPMYQYIYREAAGVYWDQEHGGFKSTPIKGLSCSQWFSHIVQVVKSGLSVELQLSHNAKWQSVPENDKNEIVQNHAI